jgi:hypothetical protein
MNIDFHIYFYEGPSLFFANHTDNVILFLNSPSQAIAFAKNNDS